MLVNLEQYVFKAVLKESVDVTSSGGLPDRHLVLSIANDFEDLKWRAGLFHQFIWDSISQTALSEAERRALVDSPQTLLSRSARNLRLTDSDDAIGSGSELAEAVLYGVMRTYYDALPVVPKIFYKQSTQDNAKGADSVHITLKDNDFQIWFGESKFYSSIEDARLATIVSSVAESLRTDKLRKENSIICNVSDLSSCIADNKILSKVKSALSEKVSIDELKPRLCVPILLLHECDFTRSTTVWSPEYERRLIEKHRDRALAYFKRQLSALPTTVSQYQEITFHVILIPVPRKETIVTRFLAAAKFHRGNGNE